jgi:hypothetical protein
MVMDITSGWMIDQRDEDITMEYEVRLLNMR